MNFSCFKPNCGRVANFECQCNEDIIYSCQKHIEKYQALDGINVVERLLKPLSEDKYKIFDRMVLK